MEVNSIPTIKGSHKYIEVALLVCFIIINHGDDRSSDFRVKMSTQAAKCNKPCYFVKCTSEISHRRKGGSYYNEECVRNIR